jgi:hypothetical protein
MPGLDVYEALGDTNVGIQGLDIGFGDVEWR